MSTRLETLQVARLASRVLGDATELVVDFLRSQQAADGGFRGRGDSPTGDLYYTVFGLDGLRALDQPAPAGTRDFLERYGDGDDVPDLVHLGCLIRGWAALGTDPGEARREAWSQRLASFRRDDGGWSTDAAIDQGSVYGSFVAIGAYQDAGLEIPRPAAAISYLTARVMPDGGYAPDADLAVSTTPTTAAAVDALRQLGVAADPRAGRWLRQRLHAQGGFLAADGAPMPDLLSTAVALHALAGLGASFDRLAEPALDYIDSLWTNRGAFHGHWADEDLDCEYTYYGLLALGHLAVAA